MTIDLSVYRYGINNVNTNSKIEIYANLKCQ